MRRTGPPSYEALLPTRKKIRREKRLGTTTTTMPRSLHNRASDQSSRRKPRTLYRKPAQ